MASAKFSTTHFPKSCPWYSGDTHCAEVNVKTASITFFGGTIDEYGMPKQFHNYLVVASPWQTKGSGVASVVALSDAPTPRPATVISPKGGATAAMELMRSHLRNLKGNLGLTEQYHAK